jgi:DNA-binding response OmpR family regulator
VPSLILVVDEDPQIHQVVGRWLADAGYACMNALTPRDARDILRAGGPDRRHPRRSVTGLTATREPVG